MSVTQKVSALTDYLNSQIVGRTTEVAAIVRAFFAGVHAVAVSETGLAKTALADRLFSSIKGARKFAIQIQQGMPVEEMMGPLNPKLLRESGELERNVEGYLPTTHFLFADELFDGSPSMLRSLLGVLNEREYRLGKQVIRCPLRFAFAATNYIPEDERLKAVIDRFGVRIRMQAIHRTDANGVKTLSMLKAYRDFHRAPITGVPKISLDEYDDIQSRIRETTIPDSVLEMYSTLVSRLAAKSRVISFSDRRACTALQMVSTAAVLEDRDEVEPNDLSDARYILCEVNNAAHIAAFDEVFLSVVGAKKINARVSDPSDDFLRITVPKSLSEFSEFLLAADKMLVKFAKNAPNVDKLDLVADRILEFTAEAAQSRAMFEESKNMSGKYITFADKSEHDIVSGLNNISSRLKTITDKATGKATAKS